jgi:hypothetical protein
MNPTRISLWINRFASDAKAVVFPAPKNPPENINFTGFFTDSFLGVLMWLAPAHFRVTFLFRLSARPSSD